MHNPPSPAQQPSALSPLYNDLSILPALSICQTPEPNVRFLQPNRQLSLYQLALIARAVQQRFSTYDVLKEQCYFHAGVIYSAVLHHFGSLSTENPQEYQDEGLSY